MNHPPDTQMETAYTKTVRLWKRDSPEGFAPTTSLTSFILSASGKLGKEKDLCDSYRTSISSYKVLSIENGFED